jgi:hypothetical protein
MSYIASFYLLDDFDFEAIASSAEVALKPGKLLGLFPRKVVDMKEAFWETIRTKAKELEEYQYSGFAYVDLFTMYPDFAPISKSSLGSRLSDVMDSTFLSFTLNEAREAIAALGSNCPSSNEIAEFMSEEGRDEEAKELEVPIQAAWQQMKKWLSQVKEGKIGLFSVG